jgi:hypothetical protein
LDWLRSVKPDQAIQTVARLFAEFAFGTEWRAAFFSFAEVQMQSGDRGSVR